MLAISWKIARGFSFLDVLLWWPRCLCGENLLGSENFQIKVQNTQRTPSCSNIPSKTCKTLALLCKNLYVININYSKCSQEISSFRLTYTIYGKKNLPKGKTQFAKWQYLRVQNFHNCSWWLKLGGCSSTTTLVITKSPPEKRGHKSLGPTQNLRPFILWSIDFTKIRSTKLLTDLSNTPRS